MTNDEIAKHATETAGKMTAHILDPKMAHEMFDRIYGQCLVGLSGNPMYECKQNKKNYDNNILSIRRWPVGRK